MISYQLYRPGRGILVSVSGKTGGMLVWLPEHWSLQAISNHLKELEEWLS